MEKEYITKEEDKSSKKKKIKKLEFRVLALPKLFTLLVFGGSTQSFTPIISLSTAERQGNS